MCLAPVVAHMQSAEVSNAYSLTLNGLDILKQKKSSGVADGQRYGVSLESIAITEMGPNGVGSMSFSIDDPSKSLTIRGGESVVFWDFTADIPLFAGTVDAYVLRPDFGDQAQSWEVTCIDLNAILDRTVVGPSFTVADSTLPISPFWATRSVWFQSVIGNNTPLRATSAPFGSGFVDSTNALPVGHVDGDSTGFGYSGLTIGGETVRSALDKVMAITEIGGTTQDQAYAAYFVDYYGNARLLNGGGQIGIQAGLPAIGEAAPFNVNTTTGSVHDLSYDVTFSGIVNQVYVVGGNAAGTGWVTDGTTGRNQAVWSQPDSTTSAKLQSYGKTYLASVGTAMIRGTYVTDRLGLRAGMAQTITHPAIGLSALRVAIQQIDTVFLGGERQHTVTFGTILSPSLTGLIRSLVS